MNGDVLIGIAIGISITNIAWTFLNRHDYKLYAKTIDRYYDIIVKMREKYEQDRQR